MDTSNEKSKKSLENDAVLKEFQDVFPNEILELPPRRDIDFIIDLVHESTLVSKSSYRMSTSKLIELKMQLQQLLDKKYFWPRMSLWGVYVLFVKKKDGTFRLCIDYR